MAPSCEATSAATRLAERGRPGQVPTLQKGVNRGSAEGVAGPDGMRITDGDARLLNRFVAADQHAAAGAAGHQHRADVESLLHEVGEAAWIGRRAVEHFGQLLNLVAVELQNTGRFQ